MTIEFELDPARELMYEEITDRFGDARVDDALEDALKQRLQQLYDNRDNLEVPSDE